MPDVLNILVGLGNKGDGMTGGLGWRVRARCLLHLLARE